MATVSRHCRASAKDVWGVLADPWMYASWVVGASRIRDVEGSWPEPESLIHHSVGAWPMLLDDTTSVVASEPGRRLRLRARGWPLGEADVVLVLEDRDDGCLITMEERVVRGPGAMVPEPVLDPAVRWRNVEALRRLALIAEGRFDGPRPSGPAGAQGPSAP
jgi:hypothetical protein